RGLDVRIALTQNVEDDGSLAVAAERLDRFASLRVEGEEKRPAGRVHDAVAIDDPAIAEDVPFARTTTKFAGDVIRPQQVPVSRIQRVHAAARIGDVHRPVYDDGRRLVADAVDDAVLKQPARSQRLHVGAVDLIDGRVPRAGQIEIVQWPVDRRLR